MILDTNFLIRLYQERQAAFEKAIELKENRELGRVPAPVVQELEYGAEFLDDPETRRKVNNITRMYPVEELIVGDHRRAGRLLARADQNSSGNDSGIDDIDAMIAAVAHRYDEPVLTENEDDFSPLSVSVETF